MEQQIEAGIKRVLNRELGIDREILERSNRDSLLLGHGIGIDSMETLTLATGLEHEFGIEIFDDEFTTETLKNLGALTDFVKRKLDSKGSGDTP